MMKQIQLERTDLNLLVLFENVMEEGHVGRAAERMHLSASAVSHGLRRLRRLLNDPLFLRTPKGVVPTARATELAGPIAEALARARHVIGIADPFDPNTSKRRFTIGAIDGIAAVIMTPLLTDVRRAAPDIDISLRQLRPGSALAELEARRIDIAIAPIEDVPSRFAERELYEEDFVIAARRRHPFLRQPTLTHYCRMQHVVVSLGDDTHTLVDRELAKKRLTRRVALWVPSFMQALAVVAESDLLLALPRRLAAMQAKRFNLVAVEAPVRLPRSTIRAVAPKVALMDAGLSWMLAAVERAAGETRRV
jgi:DNA-binding transcriptional LysR family regulator